MLERVDEDTRPDPDLGHRERCVGTTSDERPDLVRELHVGALGVADTREAHPRRPEIRFGLTLGMGTEDQAVARQHQTTADPAMLNETRCASAE